MLHRLARLGGHGWRLRDRATRVAEQRERRDRGGDEVSTTTPASGDGNAPEMEGRQREILARLRRR